MAYSKLLAKNTLDANGELYLRLFYSTNFEINYHSHDFYEILFVIKGKLNHKVNGNMTILNKATLTFIRPDDNHIITVPDEEGFIFCNIAFSRNIFNQICGFLGLSQLKGFLNNYDQPITTMLSESEFKTLKIQIDRINNLLISNPLQWKIDLTIFITQLISKFIHYDKNETNTPKWFNELCAKVNESEYFCQGVDIFTELSGKSYQHIWRMFKKHMNITPNEYITNLRLNYAAGQLILTDREVIDICYDSGFESLSHFYKLFRERFDTSPIKYRNATK